MHAEKGFSLIEVLLGIAIFMIGMLGVAALQISAVQSNTFAGNLTEATYLAGSKIEELMTIDYDHLKLTETAPADGSSGLNDAFAAADYNSDPPTGRNGLYQVYWNVAPEFPLPNMKTVKVFVSWNVKGNAQQISMQFTREKVK